ncbi:MAG TPA: acyltransferase [Pseudonocardiaceae bacterium]|jgi:acetyltransferase-like isoleucine patch superfamily enzyme|nr:acyltransferase [Pseudonocardiaceae bacterium]
MTILDDLLIRILRGPVQRLLAEERNQFTYGASENPLYRYRVHGNLERLHIDPTAIVNNALFNVSGGEITIGEYAFFGHEVAVLTGTHDITKFGRERQTTFPRSGRDVVIEEGVWVASHALVLGPVRIGKHAVVAAGSLVLDDVPPYAVVAGRPAKVIKEISAADHAAPAKQR